MQVSILVIFDFTTGHSLRDNLAGPPGRTTLNELSSRNKLFSP